MEKEIKNILCSEKNKYLKFLSVIYLILGILVLFGYFIYAIQEENIIIFVKGFIIFAVIFFSYIVSIVLYEIHQMNKYLVNNILDKNLIKQDKEKKIMKEQEKNEEEELNVLLKKLEN